MRAHFRGAIALSALVAACGNVLGFEAPVFDELASDDASVNTQPEAGDSAVEASSDPPLPDTLEPEPIDAGDAGDATDDSGTGLPPDPCLPASRAADLRADSYYGYRTVQGECRWYYQDGNNANLAYGVSGYSYWTKGGNPPALGRTGGFATLYSAGQARRVWKASRSGLAHITGTFSATEAGGSVDFYIYVSGTLKYGKVTVVYGTARPFDVLAEVNTGDLIVFIVDAGSSTSNDGTSLRAQISIP